LTVPDTGSWQGDIEGLTSALANFFASPVEVAMNAALAVGADSQVDKVQIEHWTPIFEDLFRLVERAIERGEVRPDTDPVVVMYLITGPLLLQTVLLHSTPEPALVEGIANAVHRAFAKA
jgi:hypothetical protein